MRDFGELDAPMNITTAPYLKETISNYLNEVMKMYSNLDTHRYLYGTITFVRHKKLGEYKYSKLTVLYISDKALPIVPLDKLLVLFRDDKLGEEHMSSEYRLYDGEKFIASFETTLNGVSKYYGDAFEERLTKIRNVNITYYKAPLSDVVLSMERWTGDDEFVKLLMNKYKYTEKVKLDLRKWDGKL